MTATSIFIRINVWLKFIIHMSTIVFYIIINNPPATMMDTLREFLATQNNNWSLLDHKQELSHLFYISMIAVILHLIDRQVEYILSLNIQWNEQLERDRIESETVGQINKMLLENILPPHVLKRYLYNTTVSYDQLYHESVSSNSDGDGNTRQTTSLESGERFAATADESSLVGSQDSRGALFLS